MIAVLLALLSATAFATSTVVQHRAATTVGEQQESRGPVGLFVRLLRTPAWLAGQGAAVVGFVLHGAALRFGPVVVVQPLLSAHPRHVAVAGRALVLLLAGAASLLAAAAAVWWRRLPGRRHKALALGVAAGCGFGITGVLLKQVVRHPPRDWHSLWPLLLMILVGVTSIVLAQSAYQTGALIESLPPLTVLEPVVAVAVASRAYGEHLHPGWLQHMGQGAGLVLLATGVIVIARAEMSRHTGLSEATL